MATAYLPSSVYPSRQDIVGVDVGNVEYVRCSRVFSDGPLVDIIYKVTSGTPSGTDTQQRLAGTITFANGRMGTLQPIDGFVSPEMFGAYGDAGRFELSGTSTAGSPIVTGLSSTTGLKPGMRVHHQGWGLTHATIASINSATQVTMTTNASASGTHDFSAATDDGDAFEGMFLFCGNTTLFPGVPNEPYDMNERVSTNPGILLRGAYLTNEKSFKITWPQSRILGVSSGRSIIHTRVGEDVAVIEIGELLTDEQMGNDHFTNPFGYAGNGQFSNFSIANFSPRGYWDIYRGQRHGHGFRDNGHGAHKFQDINVSGLKVGFNMRHGSDFVSFINCGVSACNIGRYWGPGAQQCSCLNFNAGGCDETEVFDKPGTITFHNPSWTNAYVRSLTFDKQPDGTMNRWGFSSNKSATGDDCAITIINAFCEGGAGAISQPQFIFVGKNPTGTPTVYTGIIHFINPKVVVNGTVIAGSKWFIDMDGMIGGRGRIIVDSPTIAGTLDYFVKGSTPFVTVRDPKYTNGMTPLTPAQFFETPGYASASFEEGFKRYNGQAGAGTAYEFGTVSNLTAAQAARGRIYSTAAGIIRFGVMHDSNADGTLDAWLDRLSWDAMTRRLSLNGDNGYGISFGNAMPSSGTYAAGHVHHNTAPSINAGKVLMGWLRLTSGSAHVSGTDWTPIYGTTS